MDYLEIKGKSQKIKITGFKLNLEQSFVSSMGGGAAAGIAKVTSFELSLKGVDIKLFIIFTHYPSQIILPQLSIFNNSKKIFEFYECNVMTLVEVEDGLVNAKLECRRLQKF